MVNRLFESVDGGAPLPDGLIRRIRQRREDSWERHVRAQFNRGIPRCDAATRFLDMQVVDPRGSLPGRITSISARAEARSKSKVRKLCVPSGKCRDCGEPLI